MFQVHTFDLATQSWLPQTTIYFTRTDTIRTWLKLQCVVTIEECIYLFCSGGGSNAGLIWVFLLDMEGKTLTFHAINTSLLYQSINFVDAVNDSVIVVSSLGACVARCSFAEFGTANLSRQDFGFSM